LVFNI